MGGEAWFFAAPVRTEHMPRMQKAKGILCFDPNREPERLRSGHDAAVTNAKRALRYTLLGEGEELREGHPEGHSPAAEKADALAAYLASDITALASYSRCHLSPFIAEMREALSQVFHDRLPPIHP